MIITEYIIYIIPILTLFNYVLNEISLSILLTSIVELDHSGIMNNSKQSIINSIITSTLVSVIFINSVSGCLIELFGCKPLFYFLSSCMLIGSIIQAINSSNVIHIIIGQILIGLSSPFIACQAFFHMLKNDDSVILMQTIYQYTVQISFVIGSSICIFIYEAQLSWMIINIIQIIFSICVVIILLFVHEPHTLSKYNICQCMNNFQLNSTKVKKEPSEREIAFRSQQIVFNFRTLMSFFYTELIIGVMDTISVLYTNYILKETLDVSVRDISVFKFFTTIILIIQNLYVIPKLSVVISYKVSFMVSCILYTLLSLIDLHVTSLLTITALVYIFQEVSKTFVRTEAIILTPEKKRPTVLSIVVVIRTFGSLCATFFSFPFGNHIPFLICAFLLLSVCMIQYIHYNTNT